MAGDAQTMAFHGPMRLPSAFVRLERESDALMRAMAAVRSCSTVSYTALASAQRVSAGRGVSLPVGEECVD
jgi:hypothetical protein